MAKGSLLRLRALVRRRVSFIVAAGLVAAPIGATGAGSPTPQATAAIALTATSQAMAATTPGPGLPRRPAHPRWSATAGRSSPPLGSTWCLGAEVVRESGGDHAGAAGVFRSPLSQPL